MKGLLIKDFKLMKNQKQFFLMILFFCIFFVVINGNPAFMISYLMVMCSFFTLSTISYDDFDHGMGYLFTLPVTRKIYVTEKYVFGLLTSAAQSYNFTDDGYSIAFLSIHRKHFLFTWNQKLNKETTAIQCSNLLFGMFYVSKLKIIWAVSVRPVPLSMLRFCI